MQSGSETDFPQSSRTPNAINHRTINHYNRILNINEHAKGKLKKMYTFVPKAHVKKSWKNLLRTQREGIRVKLGTLKL